MPSCAAVNVSLVEIALPSSERPLLPMAFAPVHFVSVLALPAPPMLPAGEPHTHAAPLHVGTCPLAQPFEAQSAKVMVPSAILALVTAPVAMVFVLYAPVTSPASVIEFCVARAPRPRLVRAVAASL